MSILRLVLACILVMAFLLSCNHQKDKHEGEEGLKEWPEMDVFHMTMAEAYHPFKDAGDLKPAKNLADSLANEAETWAASKRPDKTDNEEMTVKLMKLKTDCRTFSDHVKNTNDDIALGKELTELHHEFHSIMESFNGEGKMEERN